MNCRLKHKLFLMIILCHVCLIRSFSQDYFNLRLSFSHPSIWNISNSILPQNDGYVIVGVTGTPENFYWHRIGVLKVDHQGNEQWAKIIGSDTEEYYGGYPGSTKVLQDSNYLYVGSKGCYSNELFYNKGLLVKFDSNWDVSWILDYGDKIPPIDTSIAFFQFDICPDNSFIVTGLEYYFGSYSKPILTKIDSQGTVLWTKRFGSNVVHEGRSIACTSDSGFVIGTYKYTPGQPYTADPIIYKTDSLGNIEWTKNLGGPYMDYYPTVKMAPDGSIIVATCYADSMRTPTKAYRRVNLINLDNNGNIIWNKKYGKSTIRNYLSNIEITNDNEYICTGLIYTVEEPEISGWIFKANANGDSIWYRTYEHINGKDSENILYDIKLTIDNGFISCGYMYPLPPDTGRQDIWLLKLDSVGCDTPGCDPTVGIKHYHIEAADPSNIKIFPNPVSDHINCQLSTVNCQLSILIVDIFGKKIDEIKIPEGQKEVEINVSSYPQGIYIAVLKDPKGIIARQKFVVARP